MYVSVLPLDTDVRWEYFQQNKSYMKKTDQILKTLRWTLKWEDGQTFTRAAEAVTSLCGVLYAHGGSKLRLVLIMDQPHLRNPFQIVCGVDLHTDRITMTSVQMAWKHASAWSKHERTKVGVKLHNSAELSWVDMTHDDSDARWRRGNTRLRRLHVMLTSWTFSLALMSDGCTTEPMTFRLPWTTRASSGRSVLMPTLPWWYTESGSWPRCHSTSLSLSNWPGLDACGRDRGEGAQTTGASDISERCTHTHTHKVIAIF